MIAETKKRWGGGQRETREKVARASRQYFGASKPNKREGGSGYTYKMANLRGLSDRTGNKAKQMTKQARAAMLKAPKTSSRSHRLTAVVENATKH